MADLPGFSDFPQRAISKFLRRVDGRLDLVINGDADRAIVRRLHEASPSLFHSQSDGAKILKAGGDIPDGTKIKFSGPGKSWLRDARVESHVAADAALEDLKKRVDAGEVQNVDAQQEREAIDRMRGDYDAQAEVSAQNKANRRAERAAGDENPFKDPADDNPFTEEDLPKDSKSVNHDALDNPDVSEKDKYVKEGHTPKSPEETARMDRERVTNAEVDPMVEEIRDAQRRDRAAAKVDPEKSASQVDARAESDARTLRDMPGEGPTTRRVDQYRTDWNAREAAAERGDLHSRAGGPTADGQRKTTVDEYRAGHADRVDPEIGNTGREGVAASPPADSPEKVYEQPAPTSPERPVLEKGSPAYRAKFPEKYPETVEIPRAEYDEMMRLRNRTGLSVAENAAGDPFVTRPTAPAPEPMSNGLRDAINRAKGPVAETAAGDPYVEIPFEQRGRIINEGGLQSSRVPAPLSPDPTSSPRYNPEIVPEGTLAADAERAETARVAANDARLAEIGGKDIVERPARPVADNPFAAPELPTPEASLTGPASKAMVVDMAELQSLDDLISTLPHGVRTQMDSVGYFDAVANGEARAAEVIADAFKAGLITPEEIGNINLNGLHDEVVSLVEDDIMANPPKMQFPEEILSDVEAAKVEGAQSVKSPQGAAVEAAPSLGEQVRGGNPDGSGFLYDIGTNGKQKMVKPSKDMIGREVRTIHDRFTNSAGEAGIHEGVIQAVDARGNVSVLHADGTTGIYPRSGLGVLDTPPVAQKLAEPMPTRASVQAPVAETPVTINQTVPTATSPVVDNPFVEVPAATPVDPLITPARPNPVVTPLDPVYGPPAPGMPGGPPGPIYGPPAPVPTPSSGPVFGPPSPGSGSPVGPNTVLPENVVRAAESNARIKMGPGARTALQKYKSGQPLLPEEIDAITGGAHALDPLKGGAAKLTGMAGEEAATGLARLGLKGGARAIGSDFIGGAMGPVGLAGMIGGQVANFAGGQLDKPETVDTRGLDRSDVGQFLKGAGGTAGWAVPLAAGAIAATGGAAAIPIGLAAGALTLGTGIKNAVFDKKITPEDRLRRTYKALQGSRMALSSKDFADVMSTYRSSVEQGVKPEEAAALAQQTLSSLSQTNLQRNMTPNTRPTAGQLLALQSKYQQMTADSEARNNQYLDAALAQTNRVAQDAGPMSGLLQSQAMQLRSAIQNSNEANRNYAMLAPYYEGFAQQQKDLNSQYDKLTGATQLSGLNTLDPQAMLKAAQQQAAAGSGLGG